MLIGTQLDITTGFGYFVEKCNHMKLMIAVALSLALLSAGSCSKVSDAIDNNTNTTKGTMTATINGQTYTANSVLASVSTTMFTMYGRKSSEEEISFSIINYDKTKTKYDLSHAANQAYYRKDDVPHTSEEGELEIQSTGEHSAKGTFHFTADGFTVTNGSFEVNWD